MPVPDISGLPPFADFNDVTIKINDLVQRLRQLLLTLDTLNIRSLHAKVIEAETITGDKIAANSVTADKIEVNELSAISANLGHITAGLIEAVQIFGSYIATSQSYPRAEMSNTENIFATYSSPSSYIKMAAVGPANGSPQFSVSGGGESVFLYQQGTQSLLHSTKNLMLSSSNDIDLSPSYSGKVWVSFSQLYDIDTGESLRKQLDSKADK